MSLREVRGALEEWARNGESAAVATLIEVRRSAPRAPGARFAVSSGGHLAGSVSSGCVEGDLHEHLQKLLEEPDVGPVVLQYGISDELAAGVGLSCGGEIEVLLDRHSSEDPVWSLLYDALDATEPVVLITGVSASIRAERMAVTLDTFSGSFGSDDLDRRVRDLAAAAMGRTDARRLRLDESDPETEVFAETFAPAPRLAIIGATPIAEALCSFAARCGFEVTVIDPRSAFARPERFPDARELRLEWPDQALQDMAVDRFTSVVVLTHDAKLDEPALARALEAGCTYVGLLGGRRTQTLRRDALMAAGHDPAAVAALHGPVGLDIGARSPAQIAVSIVAELIAERQAP